MGREGRLSVIPDWPWSEPPPKLPSVTAIALACTTYEIQRDDRPLSPPSAMTQTGQSKQKRLAA